MILFWIIIRIFNSHIIEIGSSIKSVKYFYKYVYKDYDATNIIVQDTNNERAIIHHEVRSYIEETRYIIPVKACYRILSKPLQCKSHSILHLVVYLH